MTKAYNLGFQDGRTVVAEHPALPTQADVEGWAADDPSEFLVAGLGTRALAAELGLDVGMVRHRTVGFTKALKDYNKGFQEGALEAIKI